MSGPNGATLFRYRISSLMLLTAVIAVALGAGRLWLQSRAPVELDRALASCDTLRIQYPTTGANGEEIIINWDLTDLEAIREVRSLLSLHWSQEVSMDIVIMGGPSLGITVLENGNETASFYVVHSLLTTPAQPKYNMRTFGLTSGQAWELLLRLSEQKSATGS